MSDDAKMSRSEREDLGRVVRLRAKAVKASLDTVAADRRAEVEAQLSEIHRADAAQWKDITAHADRVVREANAAIARICDERAVPDTFRPSLNLSWWGRGENASADRRAELRKLAVARIESDRKAGIQLIDAWVADSLTTLVAGALTSTEAKAFLDALPTADALLPPIRVTAELEHRSAPRQLDCAK